MIRRLSLFVILVGVPVVASAQSIAIFGPPPPVGAQVFAKDDRGRNTIRATRATIDVDGDLDDEIYARVTPIDHFMQQEPDEGDPATLM